MFKPLGNCDSQSNILPLISDSDIVSAQMTSEGSHFRPLGGEEQYCPSQLMLDVKTL